MQHGDVRPLRLEGSRTLKSTAAAARMCLRTAWRKAAFTNADVGMEVCIDGDSVRIGGKVITI